MVVSATLILCISSTVEVVSKKYLQRNPDLAYNVPALVRVSAKILGRERDEVLAQARHWVDISSEHGPRRTYASFIVIYHTI